MSRRDRFDLRSVVRDADNWVLVIAIVAAILGYWNCLG